MFFFRSSFGCSVDFVNPLHLLHSPLFYFCKTETLCSVCLGVFLSKRCCVMCDIVLDFDFVKFCPIESLLFCVNEKVQICHFIFFIFCSYISVSVVLP